MLLGISVDIELPRFNGFVFSVRMERFFKPHAEKGLHLMRSVEDSSLNLGKSFPLECLHTGDLSPNTELSDSLLWNNLSLFSKRTEQAAKLPLCFFPCVTRLVVFEDDATLPKAGLLRDLWSAFSNAFFISVV